MRQQRIVGSILKIPVDDTRHTYAQVLKEPEVAVFDIISTDELDLSEIVSAPLLFRVWVMNHAITRARWTDVGKGELRGEFTKDVPRFKRDPIDQSQVSIYVGGEERRAKPMEWRGLECAAVWDPQHVEDRIRDHYAGVSNRWVRSHGMEMDT